MPDKEALKKELDEIAEKYGYKFGSLVIGTCCEDDDEDGIDDAYGQCMSMLTNLNRIVECAADAADNGETGEARDLIGNLSLGCFNEIAKTAITYELLAAALDE